MSTQKDSQHSSGAASVSASELDIARQWIEYLKKKNTTSTLLWMFFLVLALVSAGSAGLIYVKWQEQKDQTRDIVESHEKELALAQQQIKVLADKTKASDEKLALAQDKLSQLSDQSGHAGAQLALSSKLVDTLKQKISKLEQDIALLEDALVESNTRYESTKESMSASEQTMQKQLTARSSAYNALVKRQKETKAEMQRLAQELNKHEAAKKKNAQATSKIKQQLALKDSTIAAIEKDNKILEEDNQSLNEKIVSLSDENAKLEKKLKALTSPIIPSSKPKSSSAGSATTVYEPVKTTVKPLVTQPVAPIAPSKQEDKSSDAQAKASNTKTSEPSPLDFGTISIE